MDTHVVKTMDGVDYNRWGDRVIFCSLGCGRKTTMTGSKLCDGCYSNPDKVKLRWAEAFIECAVLGRPYSVHLHPNGVKVTVAEVPRHMTYKLPRGGVLRT